MGNKVKMIPCKLDCDKFKIHLYENVFEESLGIGFLPISVTRQSIKAKHILRSVKEQSIQDHLGNKVSSFDVITYNIIEFEYNLKSQILYIYNPPRSLKPLLTELCHLRTVFNSDSYLDIGTFLNIAQSNSIRMRVTSVTCNDVPLNLNSSVSFTINSSLDSRKFIKEFYCSSKPFINSCKLEGKMLDSPYEIEINSKMVFVIKRGNELLSQITGIANESIAEFAN